MLNVHQTLHPLAVGTQQLANIYPTLDMCTRYPLRLGGPRQGGIRSLPDTSTHDQHWKSNPRPSDLESNTLSTSPHAKYWFNHCVCLFQVKCVVSARFSSIQMPPRPWARFLSMWTPWTLICSHSVDIRYMDLKVGPYIMVHYSPRLPWSRVKSEKFSFFKVREFQFGQGNPYWCSFTAMNCWPR